MSKHFRARLLSVETDQNGGSLPNAQPPPLVGCRLTMFWEDVLQLGSAEVKNSDDVVIDYELGRPQRMLVVRAHDSVGRELPFSDAHPLNPRFSLTKEHRLRFQDVDDDTVPGGDLLVRKKDAAGLLVTLGQGHTPVTASGGAAATGWGLSRDNAVTVLADRDVFSHAATILGGARQSILMSQFNFGVPERFNADPAQEVPDVVLDFPPPRPDPDRRFRVGPTDPRPERLLLEAAKNGADVRIITHALDVPFILKFIVALIPFAAVFIGLVAAILFPFAVKKLRDLVDEGPGDELQKYFDEHPEIRVQLFKMPLFNAGIMHARMTVVDGLHAICQGASYLQSYIDTHTHEIDAPIRGGSTSTPDHDVGVGVTGPAVADLYRNLQLLWNNSGASDKLTTAPPIPSSQTSGGEAMCSLQIVRTITEDRIQDPADPRVKDGEHGILEAYLRAIANAEDFIYLENQYFVDCRIGDALVNAMTKNPKLRVILVLNIKPDIWYFLYPFRQRRLITRIRREINETPDQPTRFGVFTRWTHEVAPTGQTRPRMLPVNIHAKVGIVDEKWATIGTANLDYASMDRAIEVNVNLLSGVEGEPTSGIVSLLRRKLWAEHLGYFDVLGEPHADDDELATRPETGWLSLWTKRAGAALDQLRHTPELPLSFNMARVLPWPSDNETHSEPNDYLKAIGLRTHPLIPHSVVPLKSTRAFDFATGDFKPDSKAQADY